MTPSRLSWPTILAAVLAWAGQILAAPTPRSKPAEQEEGAIYATETILLPPLLVEQNVSSGWRYGQGDGFEMLSHSPDVGTAYVVDQHYVLHEMLEEILPKRLQWQTDVSRSYVLFDGADGTSVVPSEVLGALQGRVEDAEAARRKAGDVNVKTSIQAMTNYRFWEQDALSTFFVWDTFMARHSMMPTPSYVRFLLERRTPTLPVWYIEGMVELYHRAKMRTRAATGDEHGFAFSFDRPEPKQYSIDFDRPIWISVAVSEKLTQIAQSGNPSDFPVALMATESEPTPLQELFSAVPPAIRDSHEQIRFRHTAALFVRWLIENSATRADRNPKRSVSPSEEIPSRPNREALWTFVERMAVEPPTPELFKSCFGMDYATADGNMRAYLYKVHLPNKGTFKLEKDEPPKSPPVQMRSATASEVSRLKGEFQRLEAGYVKELFPEVADRYYDQARRTLRKSYDAGDRDPRLLAQLGLCECDTGNDQAARPFLESAMSAGVIRPRAYYEAARIALKQASSAVGNGPVPPADVDRTLKSLFLMRKQAPALGETYELMAEAWLRGNVAPPREGLDALGAGTRLFPRRGRLIFSTAALNASVGRLSEAEVLIDRGLSIATDSAEKARLLKLRAAIGTSKN